MLACVAVTDSLNGHGGPANDLPPLDPGNSLLRPAPATLTMSHTALDDGQAVLLLTVRTATTTLTVFLKREEALEWARLVRNAAQGLSPLALPPGVRL